MNTHLINSPFAFYVESKYIPHNIDRNIRDSSHSSILKDIMARKYNYVMQIMERVNWDDHFASIRKLSHSRKKRFTRRFIYHRLPTGKIQYLNRSRCPHCDLMFTNRTHHDNFLMCISTGVQKHNIFKSLSSTLIKLTLLHPFEHTYVLRVD